MSYIHLLKHKMRSMHLTPMKLALIVGAMVVAVSAATFWPHKAAEMIPAATAGEAQAAMTVMTTSIPQQSWSDEWYEVQKSIPADRIPDDVPTF